MAVFTPAVSPSWCPFKYIARFFQPSLSQVFAYLFGKRKFAQLDVSRMTPSASKFDALEALKISPVTKKLIQGSVRGHFLLKEAEGRFGEKGMSLDVIQGKGT